MVALRIRAILLLRCLPGLDVTENPKKAPDLLETSMEKLVIPLDVMEKHRFDHLWSRFL